MPRCMLPNSPAEGPPRIRLSHRRTRRRGSGLWGWGMSASMPLRPVRVEQVVTYLRVFGLVAGLPTILLASFPDGAHARLAWGAEAVLLVGTLALWLWRRHARPSDERLL